jgi:hypothetical protein
VAETVNAKIHSFSELTKERNKNMVKRKDPPADVDSGLRDDVM